MKKPSQHEKEAALICDKTPFNQRKKIVSLLERIHFLENREKDKKYLRKLFKCRELFYNVLRENRNSFMVSEYAQEGLAEISEMVE